MYVFIYVFIYVYVYIQRYVGRCRYICRYRYVKIYNQIIKLFLDMISWKIAEFNLISCIIKMLLSPKKLNIFFLV